MLNPNRNGQYLVEYILDGYEVRQRGTMEFLDGFWVPSEEELTDDDGNLAEDVTVTKYMALVYYDTTEQPNIDWEDSLD